MEDLDALRCGPPEGGETEQVAMEHDGSIARDGVGVSINRAMDNGSGVATVNLQNLLMVVRQRDELLEALTDLIDIIDAAGLINLSNGVQLGQTSWYVKASDRVKWARTKIGEACGLIAMTPLEHSAAQSTTPPLTVME